MKLDTNRVNEVMYIQISLSYMCIYKVSKRYEMFLRDLHIYENFLNCLLLTLDMSVCMKSSLRHLVQCIILLCCVQCNKVD